MATQILEITNFVPRPHQRQIHNSLKRFSVLVCHRRLGKTVLCINILIKDALQNKLDPPPRYAYIAPLYKQAKQVAWDYLKAYTADIPNTKVYESELKIDLPTGARIQLFGADNPDALKGMYLDGVVLDENAQMPPRLFSEVLRPLLSDRKGWAIFIGTPKGHNQFYEIYQDATLGFTNEDGVRVKDDEWMGATFKASETSIVDEKEIASNKLSMSEEEFAQEFECSFEAAIRGAYYGKLMNEAEEADPPRITSVPYDPTVPVNTCWDLGIGDDTAIWFFQQVGKELHWIDFYSNSGEALSHYVSMIRERAALWNVSNVVWGEHLLPHDADARELGSGQTRVETLTKLHLFGLRVVPRQSIEDGINAVRNRLPVSWFDRDRCARGIEALKQYCRDFDDRKQVFTNTPRHDWASHAADAIRTGCMGLQEVVERTRHSPNTNWVV